MRANFVNTFLIVHDSLHVNALGKFSFIGIRKVACQDIKLAVHRISVNAEIYRYRLKIKRQRRVVTNGVRKRILAHVSAAIFRSTECCERILVHAIDRCTCHTKEESIRKGRSHLNTEITFLRSMTLIDHYDDIVAQTKLTGNFLKAEDGRDNNLTDILSQHRHKLLTSRC